MSLFNTNDLNYVLFTMLSIDNLRIFAQVNKHYHNLIRHYLNVFYDFYGNINSIIVHPKLFHKYRSKYNIAMQAFSYGNLNIVKYICSKSDFDKHMYDDVLFNIACFYGHKHIAEYILDSETSLQEGFQYAYIKNHTHITHWLESFMDQFCFFNNYDSAFKKLCKFQIDDPIIADRLLSMLIASKINILDSKIKLICSNGLINTTKLLCDKYDILFDELPYCSCCVYDGGFHSACRSGNIDIVQFIFSRIKITDLEPLHLEIACTYGYIEIATKIIEHLKSNNEFNNRLLAKCSKECCITDNLKTFIWLENMCSEYFDYERVLYSSCRQNSINIAKYVISKCNDIDVKCLSVTSLDIMHLLIDNKLIKINDVMTSMININYKLDIKLLYWILNNITYVDQFPGLFNVIMRSGDFDLICSAFTKFPCNNDHFKYLCDQDNCIDVVKWLLLNNNNLDIIIDYSNVLKQAFADTKISLARLLCKFNPGYNVNIKHGNIEIQKN